MKISVIVPVYNMEKYLSKCIDSIINQTFSNLEIILVNDGSEDSSGEICEEYKIIDKRIIVIHKENGGLSSARNAGIEIASGELISFIDSDDWIESDFYKVLYDGIILNNADISVVHFIRIKDYEKIEFSTSTQTDWISFNKIKAMETLLTNNLIGHSAVNKLYKKDLFDGIKYPEGMLMEDKGTTYKLIHKSDKVAVNLSEKYHYYLREDSIMRSKFNDKNFDSLVFHAEMIQFIDESYPELSSVARGRYVHESIRMLLMMIRSNYSVKEDFKKCIDIIHKNRRYALGVSKIKLSVKILALSFSLFPTLPYMLAKNKIVSTILIRTKMS